MRMLSKACYVKVRCILECGYVQLTAIIWFKTFRWELPVEFGENTLLGGGTFLCHQCHPCLVKWLLDRDWFCVSEQGPLNRDDRNMQWSPLSWGMCPSGCLKSWIGLSPIYILSIGSGIRGFLSPAWEPLGESNCWLKPTPSVGHP